MIKKPYNLIVYCIAALALLAFLYIESQGKGDFYIFLSAAQDVFKGENIYDKLYNQWYHYFYSVFFAIVLHPLVYLPFQLSKFLWLSLNVFFVYRIFMIIKNLLPLHDFSKKQLLFLRYMGFLFSLRFIYENLHHSQITILILFLSLQGLQLIVTNKQPLAGAALIALGINIKLLPIVLIPYLFYRRFFKAGFLTIGIYILLLFTPAIFIGWNNNTNLLCTWGQLINPVNKVHILDTEERSFHGLSTLLSTLLVEKVPDAFALPIKRNIADISIEQLSTVLNTVRLTLILLSLYFFRSFPFKHALGLKHQFREISYLLLLVPLIFPHQQHYAFLFICPAFIFCLYYIIQNKNNISRGKFYFLTISCAVIYLVCNLKLILGEFNPYYEHFKILTYGALFLIPILAICDPEKEITSEG